MKAIWSCAAICLFASRVRMGRLFPPWLRATVKVCAGPWKFCGRKRQGGFFWAAILMADARPACLPPNSPNSWLGYSCSHTRCTPRANRRSCGPRTFLNSATPALFVHGSRDPFGSHEEMRSALALMPAENLLLEIEGAGHELLGKKANDDLPARIVQAFQGFFKE